MKRKKYYISGGKINSYNNRWISAYSCNISLMHRSSSNYLVHESKQAALRWFSRFRKKYAQIDVRGVDNAYCMKYWKRGNRI